MENLFFKFFTAFTLCSSTFIAAVSASEMTTTETRDLTLPQESKAATSTKDLSKELDIRQDFKYVAVGTGGPLIIAEGFPLVLPLMPGVEIGIRRRFNHHGVDAGIGGSTIVVINTAYARVYYLYYLQLKPDNPWYVGTGLKWGFLLPNPSGYLSPQVLFGKEYLRKSGKKNFFQIEVAPITRTSRKGWLPLPIFSFHIGIGF